MSSNTKGGKAKLKISLAGTSSVNKVIFYWVKSLERVKNLYKVYILVLILLILTTIAFQIIEF